MTATKILSPKFGELCAFELAKWETYSALAMEGQRRTIAVLLFFLATLSHSHAAGILKMTNAVCESYNKSLVVFDLCRLKVFGRNKVHLNIVFNVLHPINKAWVRIQVVKKANGYKPWLMDYSLNPCEFLRKRNHPFVKSLFKLVKDFTTINHTCPFVGVQLVKNFYVPPNAIPLPLPTGDYGVLMNFTVFEKPAFHGGVYFAYKGDE